MRWHNNIINWNQVSSAYTSRKRYPAIYAQEKLAVINGTPNGDTGLGLSNQDAFIERTEGTNGAIATATSIQPYQTYWYKDATFMSTAFEDYTKQDSSTANYYNLIMPSGTGTTYWVASRCVDAYSGYCHFLVRSVSPWRRGRLQHVRLKRLLQQRLAWAFPRNNSKL